MGCLDGMNKIENVTSYVPIEADDNFQQAQDVAVNHWFLEAGFVQVHAITASNLCGVYIHSTGNANPRIIIKSHSKFMTESSSTHCFSLERCRYKVLSEPDTHFVFRTTAKKI